MSSDHENTSGASDGLPDAASLQDDYDVVVVGSGGAGLTAALAAAVNGYRVLVVESADRFGGSTSLSGGQVWVPGNHRAAALGGVEDTIEDAREYCLHHCSPDRDLALIDAFLAAAAVMARAIEQHTPIQFTPMRSPDSFADGPGGRLAGRNLEAPHPNLGTIETPPFFAMRVLPGLVGTKGGPCTDTTGQVLDWEGRHLAGLFAAGNAADSVIGPGILSSGMALGLALTWGWLAGAAAASNLGGGV